MKTKFYVCKTCGTISSDKNYCGVCGDSDQKYLGKFYSLVDAENYYEILLANRKVSICC